MGLIGGLIRALMAPPSDYAQPATYPNQTVEYIPTQAVSPGYYAPRRTGCCSRKAERRAARRQMHAERALLRAEYRNERDMYRAERRGGCCGRRQPALVAAAVPVVQRAVGQTSGVSSRQIEGSDVRDFQEHGYADKTTSRSLAAPSNVGDAPPAYEAVQKM